MVLATGPDLIDDIKRAPDDVLSRFERFDEVCSVGVKNGAPILIKDYLALATRIHHRSFDRCQHPLLEHNAIQIGAGYRRYFQGDPRRAHDGHGRFCSYKRG
jgi:hypothetical protein